MKNWLPLVLGPALAMESMPAASCLRLGLISLLELVAGAAGAVALRVAALDHEGLRRLDDAVEGQAVVEAVAGEEDEVVHGDRRVLGGERRR